MKRDILVNWLSKLKEVLQIQIFSQKLMDKKKKNQLTYFPSTKLNVTSWERMSTVMAENTVFPEKPMYIWARKIFAD